MTQNKTFFEGYFRSTFDQIASCKAGNNSTRESGLNQLLGLAPRCMHHIAAALLVGPTMFTCFLSYALCVGPPQEALSARN